MVKEKVTICNKMGLHARPAGLFVTACSGYPCEVNIRKGDKEVNGKSIFGVMSAGVKYKDEIELICDGEDEERALRELVEFLKTGLAEE